MTDFRVEVPVPSQRRSYGVRVAAGSLQRLAEVVRQCAPEARRVGMVSDDHVMPLHGEGVAANLAAAGFDVVTHLLRPGEAHKHADALLGCVDTMLARHLTRSDCVIALGGGVVGDVAGLAAHLLLRGLPVIQCPTSLLAQVDAAVGGKVAVDRPAGKNLLGAFHFPAAVVIDPQVLSTLPRLELRCGAAEMVKHGLLSSSTAIEALRAKAGQLLGADGPGCAELIAMSVALKVAVVAADPWETRRDAGGRIVLNLGHTLGHAIEFASGYAVPHGEAVALGLRAAARFSVAMNLAPASFEAEVVELLSMFELPTDLDTWLVGEPGGRVEAALAQDKKRRHDALSYIALGGVGSPRVVATSAQKLMATLRGGAGG